MIIGKRIRIRGANARRGGVLGAVIAILLAVGIGVGVFIALTLRGAGDVDQWVVRQVVLITNSHLVPEIDFDRAQFEYPDTLRLHGATLTAPTGEEVIRAGELVITLAEIPQRGQPIVIRKVELRDGSLRILRDTSTGEFKGLLPFVRRQAVRSPETVPENARLSNVLRIEQIILRNGAIEYDDGTGRPPMILDQIELALNVDRSSVESEGPVMHRIDFSLDRAPVLSLDVLGAASLDDLSYSVERLDLNMSVGENSYGSLPPNIQEFLRDHEARGQLRILMTGEGSLQNIEMARTDATVKLDSFSVAAGEARLTIDQATLEAHMNEGVANVGPARADLLGGVLSVTMQSRISQPEMPTTATWNSSGVQLAMLQRSVTQPGSAPTLSGLVTTKGEATVNLADLPASARGNGTLSITEARLLKIPVINQIANLIDAFGGVFGTSTRTSTVESSFRLSGDGVVFERLTFTNSVAAAEATGLVGYQGTLNLTATAGPVKKITNMLGQVGRIIGAVTGQVIQYRIRGTVDKPAVTTHPLGVGA